MKLRPHPSYRVAWLILHGAGVAACHLLGWWGEYFAAVALLEAVALARTFKGRNGSATFSWTVWRFLEDGTGRLGALNVLLVGAWASWFSLGFMLHGWFPWPGVNAAVGMVFYGWVWWHFFERLARVRASRRAGSSDGPGTGGQRGNLHQG